MAQIQVTKIDVNPNGTTEARGNLSSGSVIEDLSWASNSSVACFPATQNAKFTGKHNFHHFTLPPHAEVEVTVIPDDSKQNFSLYGYQVGENKMPLPPALSSCTACEADHKWDYPKRGKTQDHTRSIFFNSIDNAYNIVIGVAGADGLAEGAYTLKISMKSAVASNEEQGALKVYEAASYKGKTAQYEGNIAEGTVIQDLSWAAGSSMACWPGTQHVKFTGNHVFYITELPAQSKMNIRLIPQNKNANMSLYAIQDGTTATALPPDIQRCTACEADHKWDYPKKGKTQDHTRSVDLNSTTNAYRVVIGVAGADGLKDGAFTLEITVL